MTDHPSNAEKFDQFSDDLLDRLHHKLEELQGIQQTETRRIQLRQVEAVQRARKLARLQHDMARHEPEDAA